MHISCIVFVCNLFGMLEHYVCSGGIETAESCMHLYIDSCFYSKDLTLNTLFNVS